MLISVAVVISSFVLVFALEVPSAAESVLTCFSCGFAEVELLGS